MTNASLCNDECLCLYAAKNYSDFLGHYRYDKSQTLHDGSTHWALPIYTTVSDLEVLKFYLIILCS